MKLSTYAESVTARERVLLHPSGREGGGEKVRATENAFLPYLSWFARCETAGAKDVVLHKKRRCATSFRHCCCVGGIETSPGERHRWQLGRRRGLQRTRRGGREEVRHSWKERGKKKKRKRAFPPLLQLRLQRHHPPLKNLLRLLHHLILRQEFVEASRGFFFESGESLVAGGELSEKGEGQSRCMSEKTAGNAPSPSIPPPLSAALLPSSAS